MEEYDDGRIFDATNVVLPQRFLLWYDVSDGYSQIKTL